ncbi:gamma-glutamyltransferase domain protein [Mycobacterium avium MAV_061107_1842]|nr:gamma-glutamyltransferase domain protein [Mycobacterium avium MAV_061107_1842]
MHLQIEAVKLAFADAQAYLADIEHMAVAAGTPAGHRIPRATGGADRPRPAKPVSAGARRAERCI